ncbi:MAG: tripartite tricarboxylate transporter substrate binding protein [Hydrogenophaga sp.]|uniref:tripartite tricarboxylate transporter substrate binding protein n=1 Tax=Hydrogenophaga sp. TaxID=1904254 RepID=UPI0025BA12B2|nr:tripartite tricarboxylate transporter substrate binding protein [Hydrogenophaga sp.]MBT9550091.1 tripartite tricarboxylate transporter substrate binding protein [Hydrogenophaga sp.]
MTRFSFSPLRRTVCAAALALTLPAAHAWTDKPVRMVVPAPAGGTMDVVARIVAEQLAADIGQPVVVENKPGAGGAIAVQAMLAAPADGNTIMMTASNILTEIPHVMKTAFDPLKDVKPVTVIARASMVLIGAPNVPAKDLKGVIAWVKAHPGTVSFASYSAGTSSHYAGMILNQKAGLDMQHVPFAGSPPALVQVMGGQIPLMFDGMATSRKMIEGGKVQAYGVASKKRSPHLPNVPTLAEQGYPDLDFSNWVGIIVATSVPSAVVQKINAAVDKTAAAPKVRDRLLGAGFDAGGDETAEQMAQSLRADFERNAAIVKAFDIKLNP